MGSKMGRYKIHGILYNKAKRLGLKIAGRSLLTPSMQVQLNANAEVM